jgi:hypothetical protein
MEGKISLTTAKKAVAAIKPIKKLFFVIFHFVFIGTNIGTKKISPKQKLHIFDDRFQKILLQDFVFQEPGDISLKALNQI